MSSNLVEHWRLVEDGDDVQMDDFVGMAAQIADAIGAGHHEVRVSAAHSFRATLTISVEIDCPSAGLIAVDTPSDPEDSP